MSAEQPPESAPPEATATDESDANSSTSAALEDSWASLEASWDDPARHKRFIALAETLGRLDEAGRRYRAVLATDPSRAGQAQKWIDHVIGRAMSQLESMREPPSIAPRRWVTAVGITVAVVLVAIALRAWLG